MTDVRPKPCAACPYRRDAPSGVWATEEYEKLRRYDAPTMEQPFNGFACHSTPEMYCNGWAITHTSRGNEFDLISLRFAPVDIPEPVVPLFGSGNEAADHGQAAIEYPDQNAQAAIELLQRQRARRR